jgi:hypothetical protein
MVDANNGEIPVAKLSVPTDAGERHVSLRGLRHYSVGAVLRPLFPDDDLLDEMLT